MGKLERQKQQLEQEMPTNNIHPETGTNLHDRESKYLKPHIP